MRLSITLPLAEGESPQSFASRLAVANPAWSAREFCRDMGLPFQRIVDGCPGTLGRLAALTGAPLPEMLHNAFRRRSQSELEADAPGRREYVLRGEILAATSLQRHRLRVCPACLLKDVEGSASKPEAAAYGRTTWLVAHLRTCPVHDVALVEIVGQQANDARHDFALLLRPALARLADLVATAFSRPPSGLEAYLLGRLDGATGCSPWLDGLEFHVAAKVCEMIGAAKAQRRRPNMQPIDDDYWYSAGAIGYAIASEGVAGVRGFLADLQATYPYTLGSAEGPQAVFGGLYRWLDSGAAHPAYGPVKDLVTLHIVETTPVGPDDVLFGTKVGRRVLHSIRTAHLETKCHPKRLRKVLAAAKLIGPDHAGRPDDRVLFDAQAAVFLNRLRGALSLKQVEDRLNAPRTQARLLAQHGFIVPLVSAGLEGIGENAFAEDEIDGFLARLVEHAELVDAPHGTRCDIPAAAKRASCSAPEIVALILERKLAWVGRQTAVRGYLGVLVDPEEVKGHVRGPALDGLTKREAVRQLGTSSRVVDALIAQGHLPTIRVVNPSNRCPVEVIPRADFDAFRSTYASLFELARLEGVHHVQLNADLSDQCVKPALERQVYGATFYRRADLPRGRALASQGQLWWSLVEETHRMNQTAGIVEVARVNEATLQALIEAAADEPTRDRVLAAVAKAGPGRSDEVLDRIKASVVARVAWLSEADPDFDDPPTAAEQKLLLEVLPPRRAA